MWIWRERWQGEMLIILSEKKAMFGTIRKRKINWLVHIRSVTGRCHVVSECNTGIEYVYVRKRRHAYYASHYTKISRTLQRIFLEIFKFYSTYDMLSFTNATLDDAKS